MWLLSKSQVMQSYISAAKAIRIKLLMQQIEISRNYTSSEDKN